MASYATYFLVEFIGAIFTLICAAYIYLKYVTYKYWSWKNIDFVKPVVPFGNLWPVLSVSTSIGELFRDIYSKFKKSQVVGVYMFHKPALVVNDPDVMRFVLTKQFMNFHDRGVYCNETVDPLSGHLFTIPGAKWKYLRTKFSPTFTSSKMKQMFFTVQECSEKMVEYVGPQAANREVIDVKDLVARFFTDAIASIAFGIQCNSIENPDAEFRSYGRKVLKPRPLMNVIMILAPSWLKLLRIVSIDTDVEKFFVSTFIKTVEYRAANNVVRKDFLDLIIQLMTKGYIESDDKKWTQPSEFDCQKITLLEGAAQAFAFWLAGFETSSSTVTNCLYELALHQDIQEKVADEANRVLAKFGGMSYNGIKEMHYLQKVVSETLRKYPAATILNRECTAEIDLPETGLHVEKGTAIIIPVYGIHHDPQIYPNPEKFDPERFTEENIASRHPYTYLPFGEGPRNCIGMGFGLVQTKVALASLLSKYRFTSDLDPEVPMAADKDNVGVAWTDGMPLRIQHLTAARILQFIFASFRVSTVPISYKVFRNIAKSITSTSSDTLFCFVPADEGNMACFSNYFVVEFIGAVFALICAAYIYLKYVAYKYWSWKNIDFAKPVVPLGNLWPVVSVSTSIGELFRDIYLEFRKSRVVGVYMFHKPALVVNDPDVIRFILTKQFANFHDRGVYCNEKVDPLSGHLFSIPGAKWKFLRTKFSPTFTSSKMKQMFFTVQECSEKMVEFVSPLAKNRELIEVKDLVARFSTDVIASVAFGVQCNSIENPNAEFRSYGRKVFRPKPWINIVGLLAPSLLNVLSISSVDADVEKFFLSAFMETVEYRTANKVARKDFLDLIIQLMNKGYIENDDKKLSQLSEFDSQKITALEGAAQAFVFWLAGFETSSSTVTNCLYELALHQDIQDKVAEEANRVLGEFGGMSYNGVKEMRYLYKVVSETLRKYPAVPILNRECTAEIDLPETGLHVEKGTAIIVPVYGLHNDPEIYPDPEKFDPERFTEEKIASRHPYAYLPFGEGPRNCIGMRFGLVQTQVALASLLSKYRFMPGPDFKVPMVLDRGNVGVSPAGGMTLRIELR
ncbi:uncharacterized protein LOC107225926 [Neodiprion lecontei]|uniref:Uncharacterized protein LOC107225926 n=1 Tax=Neodiprion lecontei TaxID=441921 RepID=A0A6J0C642_NEOLC|nr:uncharacterized protein LOC107225926 [Neodiprion lecontei]